MYFPGVTHALVPLGKPELLPPVSQDKENRLLVSLCTDTTSDAGASDLEIKFDLFLTIFLLIDSLSNGTINVLYNYVSWYSISYLKKLLYNSELIVDFLF